MALLKANDDDILASLNMFPNKIEDMELKAANNRLASNIPNNFTADNIKRMLYPKYNNSDKHFYLEALTTTSGVVADNYSSLFGRFLGYR